MNKEHAQVEAQIAENITKEQWKTGLPFHSLEQFRETFRVVMQGLHWKMKKSEYDTAGNCTTCGECGRCPGYHIA